MDADQIPAEIVEAAVRAVQDADARAARRGYSAGARPGIVAARVLTAAWPLIAAHVQRPRHPDHRRIPEVTPTDAPEPTPAVERAERALVEAWHGTIGRAFHPTRIRETRAALAAALATECHEAVADEDGEEQPCNAYAVAYREEVVGDAVLGVYPVCEEHARPPLVPLTTAILGGAQ